jgi:hypothetical protein
VALALVKSAFESGHLIFRGKTSGNIVGAFLDRGTQLTAGAVSTTAAGTIAGTTSAGAAPTVTVTDCTDIRGTFLLNPVTGGGAQAAGKVAVVRFTAALPATPASVVLTLANETDTTATIVVAALALDVNGFDIYVGTALTTAKAYRIFYQVIL